MTTDLSTASVDDLLTFLRSTEPIPRQVSRRVSDTCHPANSDAAITYARVSRQPVTPIEAATLRRPPCAATRHKARLKGDWKYANVNQLAATECRIVAWLVCRALGDQWRFEPDENRRWHRLVHRATCATLTFGRSWNNDNRYRISPENVYRSDSMPQSITVSGERSPASIARDIERRIIDAGLFDQNAACLSGGHARRRIEVARRLEVLAVARAYGGDLRPDRCWKSQGYPEATEGRFGCQADGDDSWRPATEIDARAGYSGLIVTVETYDVRLAVKVAELVRQHYAPSPQPPVPAI